MAAIGCAGAVIGFMVQMNFDPFRYGAPSDLLWLFGGLVTVIERCSCQWLSIPEFRCMNFINEDPGAGGRRLRTGLGRGA